MAQLAGGLLSKKLEYFEVMLNNFEFLRVREILGSGLVYVKINFLESPNYIS